METEVPEIKLEIILSIAGERVHERKFLGEYCVDAHKDELYKLEKLKQEALEAYYKNYDIEEDREEF